MILVHTQHSNQPPERNTCTRCIICITTELRQEPFNWNFLKADTNEMNISLAFTIFVSLIPNIILSQVCIDQKSIPLHHLMQVSLFTLKLTSDLDWAFLSFSCCWLSFHCNAYNNINHTLLHVHTIKTIIIITHVLCALPKVQSANSVLGWFIRIRWHRYSTWE